MVKSRVDHLELKKFDNFSVLRNVVQVMADVMIGVLLCNQMIGTARYLVYLAKDSIEAGWG